jgi:hypothetical protein
VFFDKNGHLNGTVVWVSTLLLTFLLHFLEVLNMIFSVEIAYPKRISLVIPDKGWHSTSK